MATNILLPEILKKHKKSLQQVNSINSACYEDLVCMADMRSVHPLPEDLKKPTNFTFYLAFEMRRINNPHFYSRMYYDFNLGKLINTLSVSELNLVYSV